MILNFILDQLVNTFGFFRFLIFLGRNIYKNEIGTQRWLSAVRVAATSSRAERAHRRLLKAAAKDGDTLLKKIVGAFINPFTIVLIVLVYCNIQTTK